MNDQAWPLIRLTATQIVVTDALYDLYFRGTGGRFNVWAEFDAREVYIRPADCGNHRLYRYTSGRGWHAPQPKTLLSQLDPSCLPLTVENPEEDGGNLVLAVPCSLLQPSLPLGSGVARPVLSPTLAPEPPEAPDLFDVFWAAYPRKQGKGAARRAWRKLVHPVPLGRILDAISWHKTTPQWKNNGNKYIPLPSTYINNKRWFDHII